MSDHPSTPADNPADNPAADPEESPRVTITEAEYLLTFAAGGLWQKVPLANAKRAADLLAKSDHYLNDPDWPRAPRLWRRVDLDTFDPTNPDGGPVETLPCRMVHQEPFDFASCTTHDTTFPLGGTCKFQGRDMWEVYAEEASEQRGRAVRAEMHLDEALMYLSLFVDDQPCAFDDGRCQVHPNHPHMPAGLCAMPGIRTLLAPEPTSAPGPFEAAGGSVGA